MEFGLKDVHVLVTGASGGIGLETAKLFCSLGAEVSAHYNTHYGPLDGLSSAYDNVQAAQADLSDETSVANMFTAIAHVGPVQVLVVNHGIWPPEDVPLADLSLHRWNNTIATNLTSSFLVCREYLTRLRNATPEVKEKAAIVLIGSTAGKYGEAGHSDYAVTKSAMMYGLTLSLKNEIVKIAPKGRVNAIAPGWVRTPMVESALANPDALRRAHATTPLKKIATPLDVANQIVVLSSTTISGHVSGQVVMVDGGIEGHLLDEPEELRDVWRTASLILSCNHRREKSRIILSLCINGSTNCRRRLIRDFKRLSSDPPSGVSGSPCPENIMIWNAVIFGPADTPFEDGTFKLLLTFDESYPNKPPTVKFISRMFHPNVYANGELCLDILQNRWSPTYDVAAILTSIQSLLHDPNPNSPANAEAAQLYRENMKEYVRRVKATVEESWLDPEERQKMQVDGEGA